MHSFLGCLCSLVVCAEVGRDPNFAEHGHPGLQNLIWSLPGPQTFSTSVDDTSDVLDSIPQKGDFFTFFTHPSAVFLKWSSWNLEKTQ